MKMLNHNFKHFIILVAFFFSFLSVNCGKTYSEEEKKYIAQVKVQRIEAHEYMKNSPHSPFNAKGKIEFTNLKYYDVNPDFKFKSKLYQYEKQDSITIFGTKGEPRKGLKFGYFKINYQGKEYKVNVTKSFNKGSEHIGIFFTDKTTGNETYEVGRYLDFDYVQDSNHIYTIDFNLAYNPYCAYNLNYSCAVPAEEDYIDLAIEAGEKKFH